MYRVFAEIFNTVKQPLLLVDRDLRVHLANRSFYRAFQVNPIDTAKTDLRELGDGQWNIPHLLTLLRQVFESDSPLEDFEVDHDFPIIGRKNMVLSARVIKGAPDMPEFILIAVDDATERRMKDQEMEEMNARLRRSNRELQDFAQVASHDLQEPLRKILAFGDRLTNGLDGSLDETNRDYLARMLVAASRMQRLINDLLVMSRLDTDSRPFVPCDLEGIVRDVVEDLTEQIRRSAGVVDISPDIPKIVADPLQMRQLFQNLIGNAIKYRKPTEPPHVSVTGALVTTPNSGTRTRKMCQLTIMDNGIGFDEKYLDRIFVMFQRLHSRSDYEGSGIGLSVCRKIVQRHNGQITATSTPGKGATFIVTIPVNPTTTGREYVRTS